MASSFLEIFGEESKAPGHVLHKVTAPGRLSILGEHIDYSGYGVFAFAIQQNITIICRANNLKQLRFRNLDSKFDQRDVKISEISIDPKSIHWTDYVICGIRGIMESMEGRCEESGDSKNDYFGVDFLVSGNIPRSAGLSSSSALVCASALAFSACQGGNEMSKTELADVCAKCERYVGTQGGGLDQATCLLSETGKALAIEFNPLRTESVDLPDGACFVVMNTLIEKWKAVSPEYNNRVIECKLAASIIAKVKYGIDFSSSKFLTLGELQQKLAVPFEQMENIVMEVLDKQAFTRDDISGALDMPWDKIAGQFPSGSDKLVELKLQQRALHVYSEARRTKECVALCKSTEDGLSSEEKLVKIGQLMNECHKSCSDLFECSCDELNTVANLALEAGSYGAQLCGAGWGGCAIALVPETILTKFIEQIKTKYYDVNEYRSSQFSEHSMFVTSPCNGAGLVPLL